MKDNNNFENVPVFRAISPAELTIELFGHFQRHQEVTHCWRKENNQWVIRPISFTEDWGEKEYTYLVKCLQNTLSAGGGVFGAFYGGQLKGFASVESRPMGSRGQYRELSSIHVSQDFRGMGAGRRLFALAKSFAAGLGGEKLYISAHSSVESQAFYKAMGCVEAQEYDADHVAAEPCDCQLECVL